MFWRQPRQRARPLLATSISFCIGGILSLGKNHARHAAICRSLGMQELIEPGGVEQQGLQRAHADAIAGAHARALLGDERLAVDGGAVARAVVEDGEVLPVETEM